jgi:type IV pilus assembly protein PilM
MDNPKMPQKKAPAAIPKPSFKLPIDKLFTLLTNLLTSPQNVIGIDIGSSYIKILQLQKSGKNYLIRNCITRALPQAAKENPAEKRKLVQEFVKEFVAEARIKTNSGRLAIYGKGVFIFSLVVPTLNKKDLRSAVSIELKKRLPFQLDINNVSFDFFVTGQLRDEKGVVGLQITCIACDRITLDEQVQLLKDMNVRPVAINTIPDCLGNLLPFCFDTLPKKTITVLDIGANTSLLNFYSGRNLVFSREIPIGGEHLTHAMAKTITTQAGSVSISVDDAEKLKRNCGIPLEDESKVEYLTDYGPLRGEHISAMLRPVLERLVMEVSRTFNYYSKTFKTPNIDELYLTGGSSRMRNIDKFLLFNLEGVQKVEPLNILKAVKGWADMGIFKQELVVEQAAPHLAVAFGLCLSQGGRVNLLPAKEKLEQKAVLLSTVLRVTFPIILLISLVFYAVNYANALKYKIFINNLDFEISRLESSVSQVREYVEMKTKLEQRKELLEKAKGKQPFWWGIIKELSNISPREVILQRIITDLTKEPKEIHLLGKIYAKYTFVDMALSQYLMILDDSPFFNRVELVSSKTDMYSPIPAADFEIVCQLNY